jgi:hypothetical protein
MGQGADKRTAVTVRDVWVNASRVVFAWAIGAKLVTRNSFTDWRIAVPKKNSTRETKAFTESEISTILKAAMKMRTVSRRILALMGG